MRLELGRFPVLPVQSGVRAYTGLILCQPVVPAFVIMTRSTNEKVADISNLCRRSHGAKSSLCCISNKQYDNVVYIILCLFINGLTEPLVSVRLASRGTVTSHRQREGDQISVEVGGRRGTHCWFTRKFMCFLG